MRTLAGNMAFPMKSIALGKEKYGLYRNGYYAMLGTGAEKAYGLLRQAVLKGFRTDIYSP